jgi:CheY-like chemotaxis protein
MFPILIVDDAREDLMLVETMLRQCKILNPILTMSGGDECIRYFREEGTSKGTSVPCLLFLDLAMYPTNGLNVLSAIRETRLAKESMLVMLSGIRDIKALQQGYQLGAKTFLIKPLTPEDFLLFLRAMDDRIKIEESERGYSLHFISQKRTVADTEYLQSGGKSVEPTVSTSASTSNGSITGDYVLQIR